MRGLLLAAVATALLAGCRTEEAVCVVQPTKGNKTAGVVRFKDVGDGRVAVEAKITGLTPNRKHAIHIHEYGDTTDLSGKSAGGHYNPGRKPHGLPPDANRHAGDLGNLEADGDGNATLKITVDNISIAGEKNPIIGRAIVIHAKVDDGGQPTGNAGARQGFGVIGIAKPK